MTTPIGLVPIHKAGEPDKPKAGEKPVHRLTDMDTSEVSLVPKGANRQPFVIVKEDAPATDTTALKATPVAKGTAGDMLAKLQAVSAGLAEATTTLQAAAEGGGVVPPEAAAKIEAAAKLLAQAAGKTLGAPAAPPPAAPAAPDNAMKGAEAVAQAVRDGLAQQTQMLKEILASGQKAGDDAATSPTRKSGEDSAAKADVDALRAEVAKSGREVAELRATVQKIGGHTVAAVGGSMANERPVAASDGVPSGFNVPDLAAGMKPRRR